MGSLSVHGSLLPRSASISLPVGSAPHRPLSKVRKRNTWTKPPLAAVGARTSPRDGRRPRPYPDLRRVRRAASATSRGSWCSRPPSPGTSIVFVYREFRRGPCGGEPSAAPSVTGLNELVLRRTHDLPRAAEPPGFRVNARIAASGAYGRPSSARRAQSRFSPLMSISPQVAPITSLVRAAVRIANSSAPGAETYLGPRSSTIKTGRSA